MVRLFPFSPISLSLSLSLEGRLDLRLVRRTKRPAQTPGRVFIVFPAWTRVPSKGLSLFRGPGDDETSNARMTTHGHFPGKRRRKRPPTHRTAVSCAPTLPGGRALGRGGNASMRMRKDAIFHTIIASMAKGKRSPKIPRIKHQATAPTEPPWNYAMVFSSFPPYFRCPVFGVRDCGLCHP